MANKYLFCVLTIIFLHAYQDAVRGETENVVEEEDGKRIVGGTIATLGQHPYMATLRFWRFNDKKEIIAWENFCGGSILSEKWILTAAHCVENIKEQEQEENKKFHVGVGIVSQIMDAGQQIEVDKIFMHPNYTMGWNDIALIRLKELIKYSKNVQSISLPPPEYKAEGEAMAMGWGSTHPKNDLIGFTLDLMTLKVEIAPPQDCSNHTAWVKSHICAGTVNAAACRGDSGGPLVKVHNGREIVVGITSLVRRECGSKPSIYESVMYHIPSFILPTIQKEDPNFNTNELFV